jgi:hypothetical protein
MVTAGSPRLPDSVGPVASTGLPRVALRPRGGDEDRRVGLIGLTSACRTQSTLRARGSARATLQRDVSKTLSGYSTLLHGLPGTFNRRASKQASNCLLAYRRGQASKWGAGRKQTLGHTSTRVTLFYSLFVPTASRLLSATADASRRGARPGAAHARAVTRAGSHFRGRINTLVLFISF